jgi:hypothetical protein
MKRLGLINKVYRAAKRLDLQQTLDCILSARPQPPHHHPVGIDHMGRL